MEPPGESSTPEISIVHTLKLFNKQKWLADLWDLERDGVLGFFNEINKDKQKYGIKDDEVLKAFPNVVSRIKEIVDTGHGSIFLTPTMVLPFLDITVEVRNFYDLVGWIFSVAAGKIDEKADRNNYYFPLICVYCIFCRRLTENRNIQAQVASAVDRTAMDFDPTMTQITWFKNPDIKDNRTYFCLSANLGLYTKASRDAFGKEKKTVRHNRGEQLKEVGILAPAINIDAVPPGGTNFYGVCAETVPFLFVKSIMKRKNTLPFDRDLVKGIALKGFTFLPVQVGDPVEKYDLDKIKGMDGCTEPCPTCSGLIKSNALLFPIDNFTNKF